MSTEIEYRYEAFSFNGQRAFKSLNELSVVQGDERFYSDYGPSHCVAAFVEEGSSNTFDGDTGRPSRHWSLQHAGELGDSMKRVIRASEYVESGMVRPFGKYQKAENYIAANRKRLMEERPLELLFRRLQGNTLALVIHSFNPEKAARHPWWKKVTAAGWVYTPPYSKEPSAVRFQVVDQLQLECALLCLGEIGNGNCGTMASFGQSTAIGGVLDQLSGGEQLSLLCA